MVLWKKLAFYLCTYFIIDVFPIFHCDCIRTVRGDGDELVCSGSLPRLEAPNLYSLTLINCDYNQLKRDTFMWLTEVKVLSIACNYTNNQSLLLEKEIFQPLTKLSIVSLTNDNLSTLPNGMFCIFINLTHVDLSHNRFKRIDSLGFELNCRKQSSDPFVNCSRVRNLSLESNLIEIIDEPSFCDLPELVSLNMRDNNLYKLHPDSFSYFLTLASLNLSGNRLSTLPLSIFQTPKLVLNLRNITLADNYFNSTIFLVLNGLSNLNDLDLSGNLIETIHKSAFENCPSLIRLNLRQNFIKHITDGAFLKLTNLTFLDLSHNQLSTINSDTFMGMKKILTLSLNHNVIDTIGNGSFLMFSLLQNLNLSHNGLATLEHTNPLFNNTYPHREFRFDLSHNEISQVDPSSFIRNGLGVKWRVNLTHNRIARVDPDSFNENTVICSLNLGHNQLRNLTRKALRSLYFIDDIDLSYNYLREFSLEDLPFGVLGKYSVNFSHNEIDTILEPTPRISHEPYVYHLRILDLSFNKLTSTSLIPNVVEILLLNNNSISHMDGNKGPFSDNDYLKEVDLRNNLLREPCVSWFQTTTRHYNNQRVKMLLAGNPFECTCQIEWLNVVVNMQSVSINTLPLIIDRGDLYCLPQYVVSAAPIKVTDLRTSSNKLFCKSTHNSSNICWCNPELIKTQPETCHLPCPLNCTCFRAILWNDTIIDCSNTGWKLLDHANFQNFSPSSTTLLLLNGNNLTRLCPSYFQKFRRLLRLSLNKSRIVDIEDETFDKMTKLVVLWLDDNRLKSLSSKTFIGLTNLQRLYLRFNELDHIDPMTFAPLTSLETLCLNNNRLRTAPMWNFKLAPSLSTLNLARNWWSCDCEYLAIFRPWLQSYSNIIRDAKSVYCIVNSAKIDNEEEEEEEVMDVTGNLTTGSTVNSIPLIAFNDTRCLKSKSTFLLSATNLAVFISVGCVVLLLISIVVLAYVYRRDVQALIYSWYGIRLFTNWQNGSDQRPTNSNNLKVYDVFVCYNSKDEAFVMEEIIPGLENIPHPYKTCLHHRDFPVGSFINESIHEAVEKSHCSMLIFTQNFVDSDWCRFEFKTAHLQVLRDSSCRMIVVLCDGGIPKNLDPEMTSFLKTNNYLTWKERLFWEKLYFALPDKRIVNQH